SKDFGDIYFAAEGGLRESRYVFLEQNNLPQAWENKNRFTIVETGFGTGLNFLCAWNLWQETQDKNARLDFISVEYHPLRKEDLAQALSAWPELKDLSDKLLEKYPPLIAGFHRLHFDD